MKNDLVITQEMLRVMFISWQSCIGLQITVHAFKECCQYLLQNNVPYVLSERFCQDELFL